MKKIHILILLVSCFSLVHSGIKIFSPPELIQRFSKNDIEVNFAYFGEIPWGKTLIGSLFYSFPGDACTFIQPLHFDSEASPIVLADRGNCSFVKKAMYAQLIGAKMLIVNDAFYEETKDFYVGDDGNGDLINIPVLMIKKSDGDNIKEFLLSSNDTVSKGVSISINFEIKKLQKVDIQLWLSTSNPDSYTFIEDFHPQYLKLKGNLNIRPLYALWFCAYCRHNNYKIKNDNCLSGGRYCYPDPDVEGPLLGKDYVKEGLRQICIFQNEPEKWWHYMKIFKFTCINSTAIENCTSDIMEKLTINKTLVKNCIDNSFVGDDEDLDDNTILKEDHEKFKNEGIQTWPSVLINNNIYKGTLDSEMVFEFICRSFSAPPDICMKEIKDLNEKRDDDSFANKYSLKNEKSPSKESNYTAFLLLALGILAAFLIFILIIKCKIFTKTAIPNDISLNISSAVSRYFAFQDKNDKEKMIEVSA